MALRVLMFGWEFPPRSSGGLGVACFGLSRALAQEGVKVRFVLPKRMDPDVTYMDFSFADVPDIVATGVNSLLYPYVTEGSYLSSYYAVGGSIYGSSLFEEVLLYASKAADIARTSSFDIIHAHDWLSFLAGLEAKRVSGKPLVVHVHATEYDRSGGTSANPRVFEIEKKGMQEADKVIAVSSWTKQIIVEKYGISPDKVEVVHNGVETHDFKPLPSNLDALKRAGKKIILFHGRITLQKGPDYFVRTAKRVLEYCPEALFIVSGIGDMLPQMIRETVALGISDKVFFVGALWDEERDRVYQAADVVMMPSVSEPFGIVPLEALANGAPVLISKQSGVAEVLSHALKSDFWDIDEMANQIVVMLRNDSLKETLRKNGGKEVETITWSKAAQKLLGIYQSLVPQFA